METVSAGLNTQVSVSEKVVFQDLEGEAVLLNFETGKYYGLDEVGTRMWNLLAEHGRLAPVLETMLEEYKVTSEQLEKDLIALLDKLLKQGLVVLA